VDCGREYRQGQIGRPAEILVDRFEIGRRSSLGHSPRRTFLRSLGSAQIGESGGRKEVLLPIHVAGRLLHRSGVGGRDLPVQEGVGNLPGAFVPAPRDLQPLCFRAEPVGLLGVVASGGWPAAGRPGGPSGAWPRSSRSSGSATMVQHLGSRHFERKFPHAGWVTYSSYSSATRKRSRPDPRSRPRPGPAVQDPSKKFGFVMVPTTSDTVFGPLWGTRMTTTCPGDQLIEPQEVLQLWCRADPRRVEERAGPVQDARIEEHSFGSRTLAAARKYTCRPLGDAPGRLRKEDWSGGRGQGVAMARGASTCARYEATHGWT